MSKDLEKERLEALEAEKRLEERAKQEEELREKAAKAHVKTIDEILKDADETRECYIPKRDYKIRYKPLLLEDLPKIQEEKDPNEMAALALYLMWSRADANVTLDKVKKIPLMEVIDILKLLGVEVGLMSQAPLGQKP